MNSYKLYIILSITCFSIVSCNNIETNSDEGISTENENKVELTQQQYENAQVEVAKIEERSISSLLKVNGKIEVPPQNMISISIPMGGYLKSTQLLPGMHVRKGEKIATLEDQQYIQLQQDYLTAKAQFTPIESAYLRQKSLFESQASSEKVMEEAKSNWLSQKILIKSLSEKLELISVNPDKLTEQTLSRTIPVYSPIDGFVSKVNMNIGKYANPTDVLFELVNPEDIHLQLTVFERDIFKLTIGQKIIAYNNIHPEKKYRCEILLIGQDVSPERTIQVHCHFEQYDKSLIPGMYMNAEIEVTTHKAYVIDNDGLVRFEDKQYVFQEIKKGAYQMLEVTTQNTENGFTQITFVDDIKDLKQTNFVTKGAYTLLMKMKNVE